MDEITIARVVHVVAVLFWIGGVAFVTLVVMPSVRALHAPDERLAAFHRIEGRFAPQARIWVLLAGASGVWMTWQGEMWGRFLNPAFWWMHLMVLIWSIFAVMLFVVEPLFLHRRMAISPAPASDFVRMQRVHQMLLAASIVAVAGAVAGSHGLI